VSETPVKKHPLEAGDDGMPLIPVKQVMAGEVHTKSETDACCISWMVNPYAEAQPSYPSNEQLQALHGEIVACAELVDAVIIEDVAMSGLVLCRPLRSLEMSQEDVAIRFGQLLCRWASHQEPAFHLRVGVDTGSLTSFPLPRSSRLTYTGDAVNGARYLVHSAEQDQMVHLSKKVRDRLSKLHSLPMMVSLKRDSFYLDSNTCVRGGQDKTSSSPISSANGRQTNRRITASMKELLQVDLEQAPEDNEGEQEDMQPMVLENTSGVIGGTDSSAMTFDDFRTLLSDHQVKLNDFGKGEARSLEELYHEVMVEKDAHLIMTSDGHLKRVKELVRISLQMRGSDNRLRELRIASSQREGGTRRQRNQKLAMVLKVKAGDNIKDCVQACFEARFNLSLAVQKQCLDVDWDTLNFKEESMVSNTVPNLTTIYKTHNLVVNIRDKSRQELSALGLPSGADFQTKSDSQAYHWTWSKVGNTQEDELLGLLTSHGIESTDFTMDAFSELYDEVYETCLSSLEVQDGVLVRKIRIVKVWLHADVLSVEHVLQVKRKIQKGKSDEQDKGRPLSMRIPKYLEWEKAVESIFFSRLGLDASAQGAISVDPLSYRLSEEVAFSRSFPGLKTVYLIDEVTAHVLDCAAPALAVIGLPDGHDFAFSRWDGPKGPGAAKLVIQHWCWLSLESFRKENRAPAQRAVLDKVKTAITMTAKRRLTVPDPESGAAQKKCFAPGTPVTALERLMKGKKTDWARAKKAAARIRDKNYTCREFIEDCSAAFPELILYINDEEMSSGRSGDDEYQRTFGAMLAFFWLMRLHLDGSQCFSFGLGADYNARRRPGGHNREDEMQWEARQAFHREADWESLRVLMVNAGLLLNESRSKQVSMMNLNWIPKSDVEQHDEERTLGMLVLTAIHDIMKSQKLLPTVSKTPYRGFQVGETIHDHDQALSYVLERQPKLLPSFAGLPRNQQASILFSQSKMEYNMGWLVQAEAPPGALLRKLREIVIEGSAEPKDVSFYFVHWFTDLAGAEPCPLEGCEKFVLKFPRKVLNQFLQSFRIIQDISTARTETEVTEAYLGWRWQNHDPPLGDPPEGVGAIARMRLVIMAQGDSKAILEAVDALGEEDRSVLFDEMAITGCRGQFFANDCPSEGSYGPAFLIYYGPALMQKAGKENPTTTLRILAEVYRQSRSLFPASPQKADDNIIVRIDALKVLALQNILSHDNETVWVLSKMSSKEAAVQLLPISKVNDTDWSMHRTLDFHEDKGGTGRRSAAPSTFGVV